MSKFIYRSLFFLAITISTAVVFNSCEKYPASSEINIGPLRPLDTLSKATVTLHLNPSFKLASHYKSVVYTLVDTLHNNLTYNVKADSLGNATTRIPSSSYNISVKGYAMYSYGSTEKLDSIAILGTLKNRTISDLVKNANLYLDYQIQGKLAAGTYKDLVFKEIFLAGNLTPDGKSASSIDQYFVIHNNSASVVYADSLFIAQGSLASDLGGNLSFDPAKINEKGFLADDIFMIPGSGKDYPIQPGGDFVIAKSATNFTPDHSFNLSNVNAEIYTPATFSPLAIADNPKVPNLSTIYRTDAEYSNFTPYIPDGQSNHAFAIGKFKGDASAFVKANTASYTYSYPASDGSGETVTSQEQTAVNIPVSNIIDAVQFAIKDDKDRLQCINPQLDKGYASYRINENDYLPGYSCVRKLRAVVNSISILQDTNNSTNDFVTEKAIYGNSVK